MTADLTSALANRDQFDPSIFIAHRSLGLVWVRECWVVDGERDEELHGPFMDFADAYEQCDRPRDWKVAQ